MRMWLAAVVAVGLCGLCSGPAFAESDPGWWAGHSTEDRRAIVDYAYERSGHSSVPYSGEAATEAEAISQDAIESGTHEFPLAEELGGEEFSAVESAGLLPSIGEILPTVGLGLGTFAAGVAIGTGIRKLFTDLAAPEGAASGGSWSWNELRWHLYGEAIFFGATVQQRPGAYLYSGGYGGSTYPIVRWFERPCDFSGFTPPSAAHLQSAVPSLAMCAEWNGREWVEYNVYVDYPYLTATEIRPKSPFRLYNSRTDWAEATVESPPNPGTRTVESALEALDGEGYELLREELDWEQTPGSVEAEEPARVGVPLEEKDTRCKEYFGDAKGSTDPGFRSPEAEPEAANWDFDVESIEGVVNPLISATQTVKLRWGTREWGYRHIVRRHGWNASAAERTRLALQTDTTPVLNPIKAESYLYYYYPPGLPEGMQCRQLVSVSYGTDAKVPVGRHIITSYIEAY